MVVPQVRAVLLDSYRMLRASRLWIVSLWLSVVIALCYASINLTERGISVLFGCYEISFPLLKKGTAEGEAFYLMLFTDLIARYWLGFISLIIAVITTSSIFPNFLKEGNIELSLSKPISRWRLFFLKYMGGLMFVLLQNLLFVTIVFIAVGMRIGEWNKSLFWVVPVMVFTFSLLFCVSTLLGVWSRSSVYALLGTLIFWVSCLLCQWAEDFSYKMAVVLPELGMQVDFKNGGLSAANPDQDYSTMKKFYKMAKSINTVLPKTRETIFSLKRTTRFRERKSALTGYDLGALILGMENSSKERKTLEKYCERLSFFYVYGTSAIFECVVLSLACWLFSRKDY